MRAFSLVSMQLQFGPVRSYANTIWRLMTHTCTVWPWVSLLCLFHYHVLILFYSHAPHLQNGIFLWTKMGAWMDWALFRDCLRTLAEVLQTSTASHWCWESGMSADIMSKHIMTHFDIVNHRCQQWWYVVQLFQEIVLQQQWRCAGEISPWSSSWRPGQSSTLLVKLVGPMQPIRKGNNYAQECLGSNGIGLFVCTR